MLLEGEFRRFNVLRGGKGPLAFRQTFLESLAIAQVEPPNLELTRANRRFMLGNSTAITGIAPVQALPTTAAQWALFNSDTYRTYWLEELLMYLTSGTPGVGGILLACLFQAPAQLGANAAGASVSPTGKIGAQAASISQGSAMIVKSGVTITSPAAPNWYPVASNNSPNVTAFAGSTFLEHRNLQGAIGIPPQFGLGLAVVAPAGTTPLFAPAARWAELEVDTE